MTTPRRSRLGWSDPMTDEPPNVPVCRLPRWVRLGLLGLSFAVLLTLVGLGLMAVYVYQANQYVQGRGEYRDAETARLEESIRQAQCDLLDTFPADVPALERARTKYQCGPGIPVELLTPEERERLGTPAAPTSAAPPPPMGSAAVPDPPRATFGTPGPTRTPEPAPTTSPEPDPLVDLGPVNDLVCDLAGVCN